MIRLTRANGKALYINPQHLIEVGHDEDYAQTLVRTMAEGWYVLESPEEVARKVLEWRLLISKYDSLRNAIAQEWGKGSQEQLICEVELVNISLYKLAGLEEPTR